MKIVYIGGQKSGKSKLAEKKILELSKTTLPYYIATYDNSYGDASMKKRIKKHLKRREDKFITIEKITKLNKVLRKNNFYIIDCISMWLLNHLELKQKKILKELDKILKSKATIVFVLNDVNHGVIPLDKLSRKYVDLSGIIGQILVKKCDEVIRVDYGIETKLK